jgi:transposase
MSFPRAGRICAAQILAELGDVRARFQSEDQLAAEAGVSPVTHASGKSRGVVFRWACNHRLRAALTCWADNSRHASPWAADVYRRAWTDRTPYDETRHNAARRFLEPTA